MNINVETKDGEVKYEITYAENAFDKIAINHILALLPKDTKVNQDNKDNKKVSFDIPLENAEIWLKIAEIKNLIEEGMLGFKDEDKIARLAQHNQIRSDYNKPKSEANNNEHQQLDDNSYKITAESKKSSPIRININPETYPPSLQFSPSDSIMPTTNASIHLLDLYLKNYSKNDKLSIVKSVEILETNQRLHKFKFELSEDEDNDIDSSKQVIENELIKKYNDFKSIIDTSLSEIDYEELDNDSPIGNLAETIFEKTIKSLSTDDDLDQKKFILGTIKDAIKDEIHNKNIEKIQKQRETQKNSTSNIGNEQDNLSKTSIKKPSIALNQTSQNDINKQATGSQSTAVRKLSINQDIQENKKPQERLKTIDEEDGEEDDSQILKTPEKADNNIKNNETAATTDIKAPTAPRVTATLRKNPIKDEKKSAVNMQVSQRNIDEINKDNNDKDINSTGLNKNSSVARNKQQNLSSNATPNSATRSPYFVDELKLQQEQKRNEAFLKAHNDFKTANENLEKTTERTDAFEKWQKQYKNKNNDIDIDKIDITTFNELEKKYVDAINNLSRALNAKNAAEQENKKDTSEVKGNSNVSKTIVEKNNPSILDRFLKSAIGSNLFGRKVYTKEENDKPVDTIPQDNSDNESVSSNSVSSSFDDISSSSAPSLPGRFGAAIGNGFSLLKNGLRGAVSSFVPSFTNSSDTTINIHNLSVSKQKFFDNIKNEVAKYNSNNYSIKDSSINIPKGKVLACEAKENTLIVTEEPDDGSGTLISKDVQPKEVMRVSVDEDKNTASISHTGEHNVWIISLQSMILSGQNECSFQFNQNHDALAKNFLDSYEYLYDTAHKRFTPEEIKKGELAEFKEMLNNITFKFTNQETKEAISNALDTNNRYNNVRTLFGIEVAKDEMNEAQKQNYKQITPRASTSLSSGPS